MIIVIAVDMLESPAKKEPICVIDVPAAYRAHQLLLQSREHGLSGQEISRTVAALLLLSVLRVCVKVRRTFHIQTFTTYYYLRASVQPCRR